MSSAAVVFGALRVKGTFFVAWASEDDENLLSFFAIKLLGQFSESQTVQGKH